MTLLVPQRRLIYSAGRSGITPGLWRDCLLAIPFWSGVPRDVSATGLPVHLVGSPTLAATDIGYALDLNGTSQGVWTAPVPFTSGSVAITIVWRRRSDAQQMVFETSANYNQKNRAFLGFMNGTNDVRSIHDTGSRYENPSFAPLLPGSWYAETTTFEHRPNGTATMVSKTYRAGVQQPEATTGQNKLPGTTGPFGTYELNIGARGKGASFNLNGQIAAVLVHDRMLTDAEIRLLGRDPFAMFRQDPAQIVTLAGNTTVQPTPGIQVPHVNLPVAAHAPTVTRSGPLAIPSVNLPVLGHAPTIAAHGRVAVPHANLPVTARAPSITAGGAHGAIAVLPVGLPVVAYPPVITAHGAITVPPANLPVTAYAPGRERAATPDFAVSASWQHHATSGSWQIHDVAGDWREA